jgi:hypothetical protein
MRRTFGHVYELCSGQERQLVGDEQALTDDGGGDRADDVDGVPR